MNHTSWQFRGKHTVGGIVFYKHAFLVKACIKGNSNTPSLYSQCYIVQWVNKCDVNLRPFNIICDVNYPIMQCNLDVRHHNVVEATN